VGPKASHSGWRRLSEICPNCQLFSNDETIEEDENSEEHANHEPETDDEQHLVTNNHTTHSVRQSDRDSTPEDNETVGEDGPEQEIVAPQRDHPSQHNSTAQQDDDESIEEDEGEGDEDQVDTVQQNPLVDGSYCDLRDLIQGHFSMSWLAVALCAVGTEHMDRIKKIIQGDYESGVYAVTLKYQGKKIVVLVDDYVPVDSAGAPAFIRPIQHNVIWPCILEKAFAKLLGSYSALTAANGSRRALHGFNKSSVLAALLGGKPRWMYWGKDDPTGKETRQLIKDHFLWTTLLKQNRVLTLTPKSTCRFGLVPFHGYHLLDVMHVEHMKSHKNSDRKSVKKLNLFLIRNSFGKSTWHGAWSQQDQIWDKYPEVKENLFLNDDRDGSLFWMELNDVRKDFETVWFN